MQENMFMKSAKWKMKWQLFVQNSKELKLSNKTEKSKINFSF